MSIEEQWWGSGTSPLNPKGPNAGGGDAGDFIGQSLRFRGAQYLRGSLPQNHQSVDWTWSCWVKFAKPFQSGNIPQYIMGTAATASAFTYLYRQGNGALASYGPDAIIGHNARSGTIQYPTVKHRDISAWYHVAWYYDSAAKVTKTFINGEFGNEVTGVTTTDTNNNRITIGGRDWDLDSTMFFEGYMAAAYFVDGQALDPTTFGRYNANGVWVPVDPKKDGDTAWYGPNGFHLTFADPGNLGKDYSGNGNDFTATGFDTVLKAPPGTYSKDLISSTGSFQTNLGAGLAFDGDTGTAAWGSGVIGTSLRFEPNPPIPFKTSLRVYTLGGNGWQETEWDGNSATNTGWQTLFTGSGEISAAKPIVQTSTYASTNPTIAAIEVDGKILAEGSTAPTYDLMEDSPTNNFATLNPLSYTGTKTPTDANLSADRAVPGDNYSHTIPFSRDVKTYVEFTLINPSALYWAFNTQGFAKINATTQIEGEGSSAYFTTAVSNWSAPNLFKGDFDASMFTGTADAFKAETYRMTYDGTIGNFKIIDAAGKVVFEGANFIVDHFFVSMRANAMDIKWNLGQQPFRYTPPAGFEPLSTANMPAAPIANGKDHFQAITGPGTGGFKMYPEGTDSTPGTGKTTEPLDTGGTSTYTPTIQGYTSPSYVLDAFFVQSSITFSINSGWFATGPVRIYTSADGNTWTREADVPNLPEGSQTYTATSPARYWRFNWIDSGPGYANFGNLTSTNAPILELAQTAFPSGLWWIKDRANANDHQIVTSLQSSANTLKFPTGYLSVGNYSPPTGDSVAWCWNYDSANPASNGFELVDYTGDGSSERRINHRLGAAPDFILIIAKTDPAATSNYVPCYLSVLGDTKFLAFSQSGGAPLATAGTVFGTGGMTATTFGVDGRQNYTNRAGYGYIAALWIAIPGYSAFGSYTGNANADGAFVYLGFRPAFVMIKSLGSGFWQIYDSTRDTYNPCQRPLEADTTAAELTGTTHDIDFLSNGFKIRTTNAAVNSTPDYFYAAFAENPFQSPVTAR